MCTDLSALIDSGSSRCFISYDIFKKINSENKLKLCKTNFKCLTANNSKLIIHGSVLIKIKIHNFSWKFNLFVADMPDINVILGSDFINFSRMVIDLHAKTFYFKFANNNKFPLTNLKKNIINVLSDEDISKKNSQPDLSHLNEVERNALIKVINKFPNVLTKRLGSCNKIKYKINLKSNEVVKCHPYQMNPPKLMIMREMIDKLLSDDVIETSTSSYSSPCFLVPKPVGHRLVIDYRKLNKNIQIESVPLPAIHSCFDWFCEAKYFTVFDLNQAYYQIPLDDSSKHLTSFCTPWNLFQFKRVPYGLAIGGQALSRLLDSIFHDIKFKYLFHYLDDLVIYSKDFDSHLKHISEVLKRLGEANLTVNPSKVRFAHHEISFLGHLISHKSLKIDPSRTQAIKKAKPPRNVKELARFIGMVNFFNKFIPNFSTIAAPLNKLRKKDVNFVWGDEQQKAFDTLKECITQPPVLKVANFNEPFVLQTDASNVGLGAVLSQKIDGVLHPIAYASKTLSPQESKKASAYELECLAIVFGMEKFRQYLEHSHFLLMTDNMALTWLLSHPRQLGKIGRWIARISSFSFDVQHIRGTQNIIADSLSRLLYDDEFSSEKCNVLLSDFPLSFTSISQHQLNDPELNIIIEDIKNKKPHNNYLLTKNVLMYKNSRKAKAKIVVPSNLVPMIFKYFHESTFGAHLGIYKTLSKINFQFYWKGMKKHISTLVKSCKLCSLSKPAQQSNIGYLASEVAKAPFQKLFIDILGKLPRTSNGNRFILVCVDAFSKFIWLKPLKEASTNSVVRALQDIFTNFSTPEILVSDNATYFKSNKFKTFLFNYGIKHVTTTPYHPRPSIAERVNRNLKSALIAFHANNQTKWDQSLDWLPLAFNVAQHESSRFTPFELLMRYRPHDPLSRLWQVNDLLPDQQFDNVSSNWRKALKNLKERHRISKFYYDKNRKPNPFKVGDSVMYKTHPLSKAADKITAKLMYRWDGPYVIQRFLTPVSVSLVDPSTNLFVKRAHITQLKRCFISPNG